MNFHKRRTNVAYIMSFSNNINLIYKIAKTIPEGHKLIVFYTRMDLDQKVIKNLQLKNVQAIYFKNGLQFVFKLLPILLTAKLIICDNYYPFLGGLRLPKGVQVIQIWHADGAVKKFGWGDPSTALRSKSDQRRFQKVYNCFTHYVVASKAMGQVFVNDYHVSASKMQLLGYPRSDRFFNSRWIRQSRKQIFAKAPKLKGRRVILYAPTYRKNVTFNPPRNLAKALTADPDAIVIVKLHPALYHQFNRIKRQIGDASHLIYLNNISTDKLLTITDMLITDYSSVAFDYSLLPNAYALVFFTYDLTSYQRAPGCQPNFLKWLPGRPITTVNKLIQVIKQNKRTNLKSFNLYWNTYNDGYASERFINHYIKPLKRRN